MIKTYTNNFVPQKPKTEFNLCCFVSLNSICYHREERRNYITAKYVEKRFALPSETDEVDMADELDLESSSSTEGDIFKEVS